MTYVGTAVMPASAANASASASSADALVAGEEAAHVVGVEPGAGGRVDEHVGVADVATLDEVGGEQALLDVVLRAGGPCCSAYQSSRWASRVFARCARSRWNVEALGSAATLVTWSMMAAARSGPPNLRA